jgi:anthranilate synthase/phosphoribosyltransferase
VSPEELSGLASVLNRKKRKVNLEGTVLDTCGTGGDGAGTFNISSLAALTCAACGAGVAKHGNRSVSSRSGSADFYEKLGIPVTLDAGSAEELFRRTGFTFLFAPLYHPSMRHVASVRREIGVRTVMNLLGPLVNPAEADVQLIGVYDPELRIPMARAAHALGRRRVMVVSSDDGLDEISVCAPTGVVEIDEKGEMHEYLLHPGELGIPPRGPEELAGGTAAENAALALDLLRRGEGNGLVDAVCVNAGAALTLCGIARDVGEGYRTAREALLGGRVYQKLSDIVKEGARLVHAGKEAAV